MELILNFFNLVGVQAVKQYGSKYLPSAFFIFPNL